MVDHNDPDSLFWFAKTKELGQRSIERSQELDTEILVHPDECWKEQPDVFPDLLAICSTLQRHYQKSRPHVN